jgi:hypothetical protein
MRATQAETSLAIVFSYCSKEVWKTSAGYRDPWSYYRGSCS